MNTLLHFVLIAVQVVLIFGLADFVAGVVHWAEDAYFTEDTPVIGPQIIRPNIVHHHFPRYFTKLSWWESAAELVLAGLVLLAIAWPLGLISWQLILFVVVSINANEIHKMAHRTRAENGTIISFLQDCRILQTPHQHGLHHSDPKNTYYCPVTNYVNPLLERLRFWDHLENIVERLTGATHRHDTAVRGQGPGPEWLAEFKPPSRKSCAQNCGRCAQCTRARNADSRAA
jgi:ubiquitin-conjugating enzyme E2 variant